MKSPLNLKVEKPDMSWPNWWLALNKIVAEKMKIPLNATGRYIDIDKANEWYEEGFSPIATFNQNLKNLPHETSKNTKIKAKETEKSKRPAYCVRWSAF